MGTWILHYILTVPVFFAIDLLWLGVLGKPIYQKYLGHLMRENVQWTAAIVFYLLFILGILIFAVYPAFKAGSAMHALKYGALFGFFTYMTYELTNYAVIKDWTWQIVPIDIVWGTVLSASVAIGSYYVGKLLGLV